MQIYRVGGAVRDALLGLPVQDHDWVVVGATPQELIAAGYLPVGKDFPVFLHPETREEYALARTERKTARGYHGFTFHAEPDVTLEQDLARRDLTINAMAQDAQGRLVDPYGGRRDLAARQLRHVTAAFREDPVRILRVARFAARFADFTVAAETMALMREMVREGEADALVAERVWQELSRGLMEAHPSRMLAVLRDCGAMARLLPELDAAWNWPWRGTATVGAHTAAMLDIAAGLQAPLPVRFACLVLGAGLQAQAKEPGAVPGAALAALCERLRVPAECRELAEVVAREHGAVHGSDALGAEGVLRLLERCDALRKPQRFAQVLQACACDAQAAGGGTPYPPQQRLGRALAAALAVHTAPIARQAQLAGLKGPQVGAAIHAARSRAVAQALTQSA